MKTTGIIYIITNRVNGKVYVGQTIRTLAQRRGEHLYRFRKAERDHLIYLAFRKHGVENFDWDVLETCEDIAELNDREEFYINKFDSYNHGYNMNTGGNTVSVETRKKLSEIFKGREITWIHRTRETWKRRFDNGEFEMPKASGAANPLSKEYVITEPNGTVHIVKGLREWCRNWKKDTLYHSGLIAVAKGEWKHTKGYKCRYADKESAETIPTGSTPKRVEAERFRHVQYGHRMIRDSDGVRFEPFRNMI